jgi:hypothetical protein
MNNTITGHRNTFTLWEIKFGECATHYKDFDRELWEIFTVGGKRKFSNIDDAKEYASALHQATGVIASIESRIKRYIKCPYDGLRYYR